MENKKNHSQFTTKKLSRLALLGALGSIAVVLEFPLIPIVPFLKYDAGDIPILVGALAYGPVAGFLLTVVISFMQSFVIHGSGGIYGFLMHVIATGLMALVVGGINKHFKQKLSLIASLTLGSITMVIGMIFCNLIITPLYLGSPIQEVLAMLPFIILFNIIKSAVNSVITYFLYEKELKHRLI